VDDARTTALFELADLILAVGRQIHAAKDVGGEVWTPLESAVMRFVDRNPGTSAGAAAEATHLISSNFSRAVRRLEEKGRVRREVDERDGRRIRLYPTERADAHLQELRAVWSRLLEGIVSPGEAESVSAVLRRIESGLAAPARTGSDQE
jgi:DNA-binding MarR family transcriptional regulator